MARLLPSMVFCFVCAVPAFRVSHTDSLHRDVATSARTHNGDLLVCVDAKKGQRLIISAADRAYWDYYYEIGQYYTQEGSTWGIRGAELEKYKSKLECWPLRKQVPHDFKCDTCKSSMHDKPELIQQCAAARNSSSFRAINERVVDAGGKCKVASDLSFREPISRCGTSRTLAVGHQPFTVYSACMLDETRISKIEADIAGLEEKAKQILEKDHLLDDLLEKALPALPAVKKRKASTGVSNPGPMLLCTSEQTGKRIFIPQDEKSYWDYRYAKGEYFTQQRFAWSADALAKMKDRLDCGGIPIPLLEELKCDECRSSSMPTPEHLQQCALAETVTDFKRIQDQVMAEGGNCLVGGMMSSGDVVTKCVKVEEQLATDASPDSDARTKLEQIGAWLPANVDDTDVQKVVDKLEDARKRELSCPISLEELFVGAHMATSNGGLSAVKSKKNGHIFLFKLNSIISAMRANPVHPETREPLTADMIWPLTKGGEAAVNAKTSASACIMDSHTEKLKAHQSVVADISAKKNEAAQLKSNAELYYA